MHIRLDTIKASRRAANLAWDSATAEYEMAQKAVDAFAKALQFARFAGMDAEIIEELRVRISDDLIGNKQGELNRMLTDAGNTCEDHQLDLGELKA